MIVKANKCLNNLQRNNNNESYIELVTNLRRIPKYNYQNENSFK